jgi:glycosyltransferase involved in cell wall biosynthesis
MELIESDGRDSAESRFSAKEGMAAMRNENLPVVMMPRADGWFCSAWWSRLLARGLCRAGMLIHSTLFSIVSRARPAPHATDRPKHILLTGLFLSDRWMSAHIRPMALSASCDRVYVVPHRLLPPLEKVVYLYPPKWMNRLFGQAAARSVWFFWKAVILRPDIVGGFHLLCNGLLALLVARIIRARSLYFCVGGWSEIIGGGAHCDNRLFGMMETDDAYVERKLLSAVGQMDLIVTMGTRARDFFRARGVAGRIEVLPGGMDAGEFPLKKPKPEYDVIGVYRLSPVKRPDVFLRAIAELVAVKPDARAVIVGRGRLMDELIALRDRLGLADHVDFVGHQEDVPGWLARAKVFLLTSDSEGVALSAMEALTAGCPAVASNVGDLPDVIHDGENGFLVPRGEPREFARRLIQLLTDESTYERFARAAKRGAAAFSLATTIGRWDEILGGNCSRDHESASTTPPVSQGTRRRPPRALQPA